MNKTLIAAFTALALSTGVAMADGSDVISDYQASKILTVPHAQPGFVQAGDSDVTGGGWQLGPFHAGHSPSRGSVGGDGSGG